MHFLCTHGEHELRKKTYEINVRAYLKYTLHFLWGLGQEGAAGEGHDGGLCDHHHHMMA